MKNHPRQLLRLVWTLILITSCSDIHSVTPTTIASKTFTDTPAPTKTVFPTRTPNPTQTFTPTPDFKDLTFQPRNANEAQAFVMFQINQGKEISEIDALFDTVNGRLAWTDSRMIDFDGDNKNELFLIVSVYLKGVGSSENVFWVAKEIQGRYNISYSKSEIASYGAKIELIDDLNNDGLQDVIFSRGLYGNGTGDDIFVAWMDNSSIAIHQITTTDLIINKMSLDSQNTKGFKNIVIIGFESGWGSSGPGRTIEEIYSTNGERYDLLQSRYLPDKYRIHVLQDAQIAFNKGNEDIAVKLWEQAAYDQSLENFPSMWIDDDEPEKYQPAFAIYRLYTYYLSKNDIANAQKYWMELNSKYPPDSPGGEFIELASEAKRLLELSQDSTFVCDGIYEFLNSTTEKADFLIEHWYWGDHNLNIVDFCPLRQ